MIPEINGRPIFPVPKFSEDFFDEVIEKIGGRRLTIDELSKLGKNSDYVIPGATIELKILEEEGLKKKDRQDKIANLFSILKTNSDIVNIDPQKIPIEIKNDFIKAISGPIKTSITKAAKQIKSTKLGLKRPFDLGILVFVNNGYKFLDIQSLLKISLNHAKHDTSQIDFVFCTSIEYHQGDFDSYVICESQYDSIVGISNNETLNNLRIAINEKFTELMTQMIKDLRNPELWNKNASPVKDIIFQRFGVEFRKLAPKVPDSRYNKNDRR